MPKLVGWRCTEDCGWYGSDRPGDNRCPRCGAATWHREEVPSAAVAPDGNLRDQPAAVNYVLDEKAWEQVVSAGPANPIVLEDPRERLYRRYAAFGKKLARLLADKQIAYGDSFGQSHEVLAILFPNGVTAEQYRDLLTITRIVDKLFRVANQKDYGGENPYQDIAGYATLAACEDEQGVASTPDEPKELVRL